MKQVFALKAKAIPLRSRTRPTNVLCKTDISFTLQIPFDSSGQINEQHMLTNSAQQRATGSTYLGLLFVESVSAEHGCNGFKRRSQRKHELLKLVLILPCRRDKKAQV